MKRSKVTYEEWKCILLKELHGKRVASDLITGYVGLINIKEVSEPQIWKFKGKDIVVCDKGIKWLTILPQDDWYCITAMMNEKEEILLWYIDMIAVQGIDTDGVAFFDDLYLDLVVYPDGTVIVDDMDELEDALQEGDITRGQFQLAIETADRLKSGMLSDMNAFIRYTKACRDLVR